MLERLAEQLKAGENAARSIADERQRAVQYAEAEKVALTRLLHQQDATNKDLLKEIEEVQAVRVFNDFKERKILMFWKLNTEKEIVTPYMGYIPSTHKKKRNPSPILIKVDVTKMDRQALYLIVR